MNQTNQNWNLRFTRRSSLSDGHYVRMDDDRITPARLLGGLLVVVGFISFILLMSMVA